MALRPFSVLIIDAVVGKHRPNLSQHCFGSMDDKEVNEKVTPDLDKLARRGLNHQPRGLASPPARDHRAHRAEDLAACHRQRQPGHAPGVGPQGEALSPSCGAGRDRDAAMPVGFPLSPT